MKPIYLDNHATTQCDPAVIEEMMGWFAAPSNASSRAHSFGRAARRVVEEARATVASHFHCSPKEVFFTSGATEANNLAILGLTSAKKSGHIITFSTEHKAVLDAFEQCKREGFMVTVLPVDSAGRVNVDELRRAIRANTVLVSVMAVNNEIGVIAPLAEIAACCEEHGVLLHVDAAQAAYLPLNLRELKIDLLSCSAHKLYGPQGIGALIVRRRFPKTKLVPLLFGGGQQRCLRPGTLPTALIVGFAKAISLLDSQLEHEAERLEGLRTKLQTALMNEGGLVNGHLTYRVVNNLNLRFPGVEAASLLMALRPIALSTGSACTSESLSPSHVLKAIGLSSSQCTECVRVGLGRFTTSEEVDLVIERFRSALGTIRSHN